MVGRTAARRPESAVPAAAPADRPERNTASIVEKAYVLENESEKPRPGDLQDHRERSAEPDHEKHRRHRRQCRHTCLRGRFRRLFTASFTSPLSPTSLAVPHPAGGGGGG